MFRFSNGMSSAEFLSELERFIGFWLGPRKAEFGEAAEDVDRKQLPEPLARFYRFAGRWPTVSREYSGAPHAFATQDSLRTFKQLETTREGRLVFLDENQGVWRCATDIAGADPRVWVSGEARGRSDDEWIELECNLSCFLASFVLQELMFGSRLCSANDVLVESMRARLDAAIPLWTQAPFVYGRENRKFSLLDDSILVAEFSGSLWFAANSPQGISILESRMGGVCRASVSLPSRWSVEILPDGSGKLSLSGAKDAAAQFPRGTFDFAQVCQVLRNGSDEEGQPRGHEYFVFLQKEGDGFARGRGLRELGIATRLFTQAMNAVTQKQPMYDAAIRSVSLP